ncbi:MAG: BPL-N domain-containing protein [Humidesulfovibrio sp.]|uniref:BPL-N domain-containing protein n=1 Tax=Humidesulfovibrio sp. TaxID=2910988 RepID=UPI0027FE65A3|nr:BPL-N domain-containing protein [Humidesulfovibrio sp.]MDQ7836388.1 BPL-N domain-containing protein [Humidesulfovibrio sp.]
MARVFVLWDESHLWGVLVLRALRALKQPHVILRAHDIAEGALAGKPTAPCLFMGGGALADPSGGPDLLIVPGGWARGRAERLGPQGMQAIRDFVAAGGSYLGFCGGAGLALSGARPGDSLGLCPWGRMGFAGRLQHFLSGHVRLGLDTGDPLCPPGVSGAGGGGEILAPVWWPAQFAPPPKGQKDDVRVLARYAGLGADFWVADLNLALLPEETLSDWENLYGVQIHPDFLTSRPAVIAGSFGAGRYVLSYPHLETPDSPQANAWFTHLLRELAGADPDAKPDANSNGSAIAPWNIGLDKCLWPDPGLLAAKAALERVIALGESHLLLFWRNPWLLGWRRGLPGPGINSVYALVCEALAAAPTASALAYWTEHGAEFARLSELFCSGLSGLLLAERLDMTVRATDSDQAFTYSLRETRRALFGTAPALGGLCGELLRMLEELCARLWGAE